MNTTVQTTGADAFSLHCKIIIPNKTLDNITRALLLGSIKKKDIFGVFTISMPYDSPIELRRGCGVRLLTSSGME